MCVWDKLLDGTELQSSAGEGPTLDYLQFRDERISIFVKVKSLGVNLDNHMNFDDQFDDVCRSSINHLRNLLRIPRYLDVNVALTVIHIFVAMQLDYCNHLYLGLPKYKVKKLPQIQNIAARYVTGARNMTILLISSYNFIGRQSHIGLCLNIFLSTNHWMVSAHNIEQISWNIGNQLGLFAQIFKTC